MTIPHKILIFTILSILFPYGCTKAGNGDSTNGQGEEITFSPSFSTSAVPAKADLYDETNIISEDGEGDFSVIAYKTGTKTKHFLQHERVSYWFGNWVFYDEQSNTDYKRYWPQTYALDFFAFMPYDFADRQDNYVAIDPVDQKISCTIPLDKAGQEAAHEFVYAFKVNQTADKDNGTPRVGNDVEITFQHLFAAVRFVLGEAHGNTVIHSVGLADMKYKETFDIPSALWTLTGASGTMNIDTDDIKVGAGLNTGGMIGGTQLVIPQSTSGVKVTVSFTWNEEKKDASVDLGSGQWEPGHIYTYKLNLGDNEEDILGNVTVEPWDADPYKHPIPVE